MNKTTRMTKMKTKMTRPIIAPSCSWSACGSSNCSSNGLLPPVVTLLLVDINPPTSVDLDEVVPYFAVPRYGRHAYFTTYVQPAGGGVQLILVGCNVSSDVGVVGRVLEESSSIIIR